MDSSKHTDLDKAAQLLPHSYRSYGQYAVFEMVLGFVLISGVSGLFVFGGDFYLPVERIAYIFRIVAFVAWLPAAVFVGRELRAWLRFGRSRVVLDPNPGQIGGAVAGFMDLDVEFKDTDDAIATLSCLKVVVKKRRRRRKVLYEVLWQSHAPCSREHRAKQTRLGFLFQPPESLQQTNADSASDLIVWNLGFRIPLKGVNYDREFDIPVLRVPERLLMAKRADSALILPELVSDKLPEVSQLGDATTFTFSGYQFSKGRILKLIGGLAMMVAANPVTSLGAFNINLMVMKLVVFGIGVWLFFSEFYELIRKRQTVVTYQSIETVNRILGVPFKKKIIPGEVESIRIERSSQYISGMGLLLEYSVICYGKFGVRYVCAERLLGIRSALHVREKLILAAGLDPADYSKYSLGIE